MEISKGQATKQLTLLSEGHVCNLPYYIETFSQESSKVLSSAKKTLNHMAWEKNAMGNRRMNQGREFCIIAAHQTHLYSAEK